MKSYVPVNILDMKYFSMLYWAHYLPFFIVSPIGRTLSKRFLQLHSADALHSANSARDMFSK